MGQHRSRSRATSSGQGEPLLLSGWVGRGSGGHTHALPKTAKSQPTRAHAARRSRCWSCRTWTTAACASSAMSRRPPWPPCPPRTPCTWGPTTSSRTTPPTRCSGHSATSATAARTTCTCWCVRFSPPSLAWGGSEGSGKAQAGSASGVRGHPCWWCAAQAAHGTKFIFNRTFSDEAGASPNWLFKVNTSETPSGKAIVKVACIPVGKAPAQVSDLGSDPAARGPTTPATALFGSRRVGRGSLCCAGRAALLAVADRQARQAVPGHRKGLRGLRVHW